MALQFRLLWDELTDPTGTKLISRIQAAIPDPDQLADNDEQNQILGKAHISISDIKYQELEDKLAGCQHNCSELQRENQRLLADQAKADAAIGELRSQLEDQATKSGEWWEKAKLAQEEVKRLRQLEKDSTEQIIELTQDGFKAASILKEALKLKAGNGGAIKTYIREALPLIDDI